MNTATAMTAKVTASAAETAASWAPSRRPADRSMAASQPGSPAPWPDTRAASPARLAVSRLS